MNKSITPTFMYPGWFRILGIILILAGILVFVRRVVTYDIVDFAGGSFPVAMGLMMIFFAREKDFDERIAFLKLKALAAAIPIAAFITMGINYLENFEGYSIETESWFSISAFECLTITLLIAIGWFQYLKFKE